MADGLQMALHDNAATQKSGFSACGTRLIHEPGPRVFSLQRYSPHSVVKGRRYLMVADQGMAISMLKCNTLRGSIGL